MVCRAEKGVDPASSMIIAETPHNQNRHNS